SAQALIGGDENYCSFADVALFQQRMTELTHPGRRFALNAVQQIGERAPCQRRLLRLRIFDAATICIAFVICAVLLMDRMRRRKSRILCIDQKSKGYSGAHFHVCLNSSAAAFNSATKSLLSAFSFSIFRSNSTLRVVRNSVSFAWNSLIRAT